MTRNARVTVNAAHDLGVLDRLWASLGYDEINWTYTPQGRRTLQTIGAFAETPYHVRPHNIFTSGTGLGLPHWGSGNVYHEDADGTPYYDFTIADLTYDAIVGAGHHPLVELGFTPLALVPDQCEDGLPVRRQSEPLQRVRGRLVVLSAQGLRPIRRTGRCARRTHAGAVRRRRGAALALGAVERARHHLLARYAGAVLRAVRRD